MGPDNAHIGDVVDVLIDKSGKVEAVIVGVGGFLGIGEKNVALDMSAFQIVPSNTGSAVNTTPQQRPERHQAEGLVDQGPAQGGAGLRVLEGASDDRHDAASGEPGKSADEPADGSVTPSVL